MDKYELTTLWQNTLGLKNQTNGYQEQGKHPTPILAV